MTKEQLSELYKLHKAGGKLLYGIGNYPISIGDYDEALSNLKLLQKINYNDYMRFLSTIGCLENNSILEIEQYLEVIKENGIR